MEKEKQNTFEITITNGAGARLRSLMQFFKLETAKDTIGLALELLDSAKDAKEIILRKKDGSEKKVVIDKPDEND